jgi:hypothetical protein
MLYAVARLIEFECWLNRLRGALQVKAKDEIASTEEH